MNVEACSTTRKDAPVHLSRETSQPKLDDFQTSRRLITTHMIRNRFWKLDVLVDPSGTFARLKTRQFRMSKDIEVVSANAW